MKRLIIAAALGASALTGIAVAQTTPAPQARGLKADTNGDGTISRAEFMARAEAQFAQIDADRNGSVTAEERRAAYGATRAARASRRTGQPVVAPSSPMGAENSPLAGMERMGRGRGGGGGGARLLARADTDKDGRISLAEFRALPRPQGRALPEGMSEADLAARQATRFQRWDTNSDGYVDAAEMSAIGGRRGARGGMAPPPASAPSGG